MALPEHVYQNINNHNSINQALHQYNKLRRHKTRQRRHTKKTVTQNPLSSQNSSSFTPSPFPESREPVTINSKKAPESPENPFKQIDVTPPPSKESNIKTTANASLKKPAQSEEPIPRKKHSLTNKTKKAPAKSRLTQNESGNVSGNTVLPKKRSIEEKWLQEKPKSNPYAKFSANPRKNMHSGKPDKHIIWKPGRGTIEKIDKHTGEIVHLVERNS